MDLLPVYSMWKEPLTMCQVDSLRRYNNTIICSCSLVSNQNSERKDHIEALRYFLIFLFEWGYMRACDTDDAVSARSYFIFRKLKEKDPSMSLLLHTSRLCRMAGQGSMMYSLPVAKNGSLRMVSYNLKNNKSVVSKKEKCI